MTTRIQGEMANSSDFVLQSEKGVASGVASLDGSGKVPASELPATATGALTYQGSWNANTNSPALTSGVGTQGHYNVVGTAGSTNLDGITDWKAGDWAVYNGTAWEKVDNTEVDITALANTWTGIQTHDKVEVLMLNDTATVGADSPELPPELKFEGHMWNSSLADEIFRGSIEVRDLSQNTNPTTSKMSFKLASDGGTPSEQMYIASNGKFFIAGGAEFQGQTEDDANSLYVRNVAAATTGNPQNSNKVRLEGRAWNSSAGNREVEAYLQVINISNNANPTIDRLAFWVGSAAVAPTEKMALTSQGRLGIGVTTPAEALEIAGNIKADGANIPLLLNTQTASYTAVLSDANKYIRMNVATANNFTVLLNSSVAFPTGTQLHVRQVGVGQTTIVAAGGVTITTPESLKLKGQNATVTLIKVGTDAWELMGHLELA